MKEDIENINIGDPFALFFDKDEFSADLVEVSKIDGFKEYLRQTLALDIKRYFSCPKEQQEMVKGAFHRTKYILDVLNKVSEKELEKQVD